MKIVHINTFSYKSTGSIMMSIHKMLLSKGEESYVVWGRGRQAERDNEIKLDDKLGIALHGVYSRIFDAVGFGSIKATKRLICILEEIQPDIIHLHNLHGYYINIDLLFQYIKRNNIYVVWTLHDCWSFTGHCCNFESINCEKWKNGCYECEQKKRYPSSLILDRSSNNYRVKKEIFGQVERMNLVVPSKWLGDLVKESFLKDYPIKLIHNGIDLNIFAPTYGDFKVTYGIQNKKVILGVASEWTPTKGLKDLIELANLLGEEYQVVVVGVNQQQREKLPKNVIGITRTDDVKQLAEIYTEAYCFVNPTYDDNFPTVNLEALACGTPVVTYKTGGSPEAIDNKCGCVVECGDIQGLVAAIRRLKIDSQYCLNFVKKFSKSECFQQYIEFYKSLLEKKS